MSESFLLSSPELLAVSASQPVSEEMSDHVVWTVSYHPTLSSSKRGPWRPVVGTLHAADQSGNGDVSVGAILKNIHGADPDDFEAALADSDALETLYDVARSHLLPVMRSVGCDIVLDRKAPEVELHELPDGSIEED